MARRAACEAVSRGGAAVKMNEKARSFWARTRVRVWPDPCVLVRLSHDHAAEAAAIAAAAPFAAIVVEHDEVSLTVAESRWTTSPLRHAARDVQRALRVVTLDTVMEFDVTGYLAPLASRLAAEGIPIVPQCSFSRDHILVPDRALSRAIEVIEALIAEAGED